MWGSGLRGAERGRPLPNRERVFESAMQEIVLFFFLRPFIQVHNSKHSKTLPCNIYHTRFCTHQRRKLCYATKPFEKLEHELKRRGLKICRSLGHLLPVRCNHEFPHDNSHTQCFTFHLMCLNAVLRSSVFRIDNNAS